MKKAVWKIKIMLWKKIFDPFTNAKTLKFLISFNPMQMTNYSKKITPELGDNEVLKYIC